MLGVQAADLLGCRFAVSPLFELGSAVRTTHQPAGQRWHLPWLELMTAQALPDGLAVLQALQPPRGYTPDFIAPTPSGPGTTVQDELAQVARTPAEQVAHKLRRCQADQTEPRASATLADLLDDPARARSTITNALLSCWTSMLAPHWSRVQHLLNSDIAHRAQLLADHGLSHLLQHVHPDVRYQDDTVQVDWRQPTVHSRRDVDGAGLVLMPSAFTWPHPVAVLDPPWQPTIVYPARGVAALWHTSAPDPPSALTAVLGATRARLLTDLGEPDDTTSIAARYDMAPSSLSRHLQALRAAGLLTARRQQRRVLYQRTRLGAALAQAEPDGEGSASG